MDITIRHEDFDGIQDYWVSKRYQLYWSSIFVLPNWMKIWWQEFGSNNNILLGSVRQQEQIIGIFPLKTNDSIATFIGSPDLCDYMDFIITPGKEDVFFTTILREFDRLAIKELDLGRCRPDSTVVKYLLPIAQELGYAVDYNQGDVSLELELPKSWEEYLKVLTRKQRHEVRRKLRRLEEAGDVNYRCIKAVDELDDSLNMFFKLFSYSHEEKARFMTIQKEAFFKSLAKSMAEIGLLHFGIVELNKTIVAMIMLFDYADTVYLYNSAYNPEFDNLSVGILSKVLCLKQSIESGKKKWDFLQGGESYKYRIGGEEIPLYQCRIRLDDRGDMT